MTKEAQLPPALGTGTDDCSELAPDVLDAALGSALGSGRPDAAPDVETAPGVG